ncbi:MAG: primase [Candidatus Saccharibacteria bacterium]|nr:primase [Candidatus Saccharibacteria bacterium]
MDAVEDIKQRLSIEDVISQYVELKRAGRNFRGLSPFGNEKTPSFMVSPEKQIWHDFSSGRGGNMFSFVMEMEGVDFKGALELLARKAGIDLGQYRGSNYGERTKQKERLYQALDLAAKFYQVQFTKHRQALDYILKQRRFTKAIALEFRIGYSPNTGTALTKFLLGKGFSLDELKKAGLSTQRYSTPNDMFRGRIMIPLMDNVGRVIGFTARLLDDDDPNAPKYINTPQTLLYDKSRHVYGLHLAKEAIRIKDYAVLVEGNLDVIASHQAGVKQTVATAGTALTESHLKALARFTHDVRLAFDQDKAGLAATERAIPIASKVEVSLGIVSVPAGKDPDELVKKDPKAWEQIIEKPQDAVDWLMERYAKELDITTAKGKREFSSVIMKTVGQLPDKVEQDHYATRVAELLNIAPDAVRSKLGQKTSTVLRKSVPQETGAPSKRRAEQLKLQNHFLSLCLMRPELRDYISPITPDMLHEEPARKLLAHLRAEQGVEVVDLTAAPLQALGDYVNILVFQFEQLYKGLEPLELRYETARLQARLIEQYVKNQKLTLAEAMRSADEATTDQLLTRAKELDVLLKGHHGG